MKQRTSQYKKQLIQNYIQEGFEIKKAIEAEYEGLQNALGQPERTEWGINDPAREAINYQLDEAMAKWLERTTEQFDQIIGKRKWADVFGTGCSSFDDYIDKLYKLQNELSIGLEEDGEKVIAIVLSQAKIINLSSGKELGLNGTDSWNFIKILIEAEGQKVPYEEILANFPSKRRSGTVSKVCGDLKRNFLNKLKEIDVSEGDLKKLISVKNSHQLNLKYVEIR